MYIQNIQEQKELKLSRPLYTVNYKALEGTSDFRQPFFHTFVSIRFTIVFYITISLKERF